MYMCVFVYVYVSLCIIAFQKIIFNKTTFVLFSVPHVYSHQLTEKDSSK